MFTGLKVLTVRVQKYQKETICRNTKFLSITYKYLIFIVLKVLTVHVQKYQKKQFVEIQSFLVSYTSI